MPIPLQPPFELLPAYRPVAFESFVTIGDTVGVAENALVTIFKNGLPVVKKIPYKSLRNSPNVAPSFTDYFFNIDIQKYCQDLLGPFADLPSIFPSSTDIAAVNSELFDVFQITIGYDYIDLATGLLTPTIANDFSNLYDIFAASRKNQEPMSLDDYLGTTPLTPDRLFLTKSARTLKVCATENAFLSVVQTFNAFPTNGFLLFLYDENGAGISTSLAFLPTPVGAAQVTLNTGLESLANATWVIGSPVIPDPAIASYEIQFGFITVLVGPAYLFQPQTEVFKYEVKPECCDRKSLRLHWMNLLGGPDSYTFDEDKDLQLSTNHNIGQKALGWGIGSATPNTVSDIGNMKLKSEGRYFYNLNSKILTNAEAAWLAEILTSPKVYAEIGGDMIAVIVEKTTQSVTRDTGKIRFPITVTISNDPIIQRS